MAAIVALGLGIGAATAIFSVFDIVLLRAGGKYRVICLRRLGRMISCAEVVNRRLPCLPASERVSNPLPAMASCPQGEGALWGAALLFLGRP